LIQKIAKDPDVKLDIVDSMDRMWGKILDNTKLFSRGITWKQYMAYLDEKEKMKEQEREKDGKQ
jgi:hypothetical protein